MKNIDDNIFLKFLTNQLSHEEQLDTEARLIKLGEGPAILACASGIWDATPDAIDIVGDVTSIKIDQNDRIEKSNDSIEGNELIKEIAMIRLTQKDGETIKNITEAYVSSMNPEISLDENLKNFYMNQCPGTFPEDAEDMIQKIKEGVTSFDSALAEMISSDDFQVTKLTDTILEGKSLEEKYEVLVNLLAALNALQSANTDQDETFEQIKDRCFTAGVPVTDEMVAEVIAQLEDVLSNGTCTMVSIESLNELIKTVPGGEETIKNFVADQKSLYEQKMILSTAIMIGVRNEQLESLANQNVTPQVVGAGVASGLEQQKLLSELQRGTTTLDKALKVLKYIGAAALLGAGIWFSMGLLGGISNIVMASIIAALGLESAVAAWLVTGLVVTLPLATVYFEGLVYVLEKAATFYDWVLSKVRKNTTEKTSFVDWLNFKIESGEIKENDVEAQATPTVFA